MSDRNFFTELKRRNVIRMAGLYLVGAWLLIQVASTMLPAFDGPPWVLRGLIIILAIGFIPMLIFSWIFELTPQGLKRDEDVRPEESIAPQTARRMNHTIIAVLVAALGYFAIDKFVIAPRRQMGGGRNAGEGAAGLSTQATPDAQGLAGARPSIPEKSIAVLPFVNMSSDRENEYFVDGLTEEILTRLAQISALRVPGRTSSFAFKGKNTDLRQIGTELGVAHVLEGSVRKSGDHLRITAQLVRTVDGFHLWSQNFDRKLNDVFTIQEEIARAIADALSAPLGLAEPTNPQRQTKDMEVYDKFLQARALLAQRSPDMLRRAIELLTAAVDRDPRFATGWAALAQARALAFYYLTDIPDPLKAAEEAARKALALDDSIATAHSALADVLRDRHDWLAAESEYKRALQLSPGEAETHNQYAQMLLKLGRISDALRHGLRACELEPLGWVPPSVVSLAYLSHGDLVQSRTFLDRSEKLSDRPRGFQTRMELIYALSRQDRDATRRALTLAQQTTWAPGSPKPALIDALDQALAGFQNSSAAPWDLGKTLKEFGPSGRLPLSAVAVFVGQKQVALDAIFLEEKTPGNDIAALIWTPAYQPLRNEPRFLEFLKTIKMPEYWRVVGWSEFCHAKGDKDFECSGP
ncbi:MAG TPA: hypothetical protein VGG94_00860 [Chthoniobacterales bacterium]